MVTLPLGLPTTPSEAELKMSVLGVLDDAERGDPLLLLLLGVERGLDFEQKLGVVQQIVADDVLDILAVDAGRACLDGMRQPCPTRRSRADGVAGARMPSATASAAADKSTSWRSCTIPSAQKAQ